MGGPSVLRAAAASSARWVHAARAQALGAFHAGEELNPANKELADRARQVRLGWQRSAT